MSTKFKPRQWHIWTAIAIAALSLGDALYLWRAGKSLSEVLHGAVQVTLLLFLSELAVIIVLEQDEFLSYAKGIIDRTASALMRFEDLVHADNAHPLLCLLGREAIRDLLRTYRLTEHGCTVTGQHEAIESYLRFWQYLIERQHKMRRAIIVRVVHSLSIDIWRSKSMKPILDKQGEFIEAGGEVERTIISPDHCGDAYEAVIKEMKDRGIRVAFVQQSEFESDFLFTEGLDVAAVWTGTVMARRIQKIEYIVGVSDDDKQAFRDRWEAANIGASHR